MKKIINKLNSFANMVVKGIKFLWKEYHFLVPFCMWKRYTNLFIDKVKKSFIIFYNPDSIKEYNDYLSKYISQNIIINKKIKNDILVTIFIIVQDDKFLKECIKSCINQTYSNISIEVVGYFNLKFMGKEKNVSFHCLNKKENILTKLNDLVFRNIGNYFLFLDSNGVIDENFVYFAIRDILDNDSLSLIYTDEDFINENGVRCNPLFKPDFSYDTLLGYNYINHFSLINRETFIKVNGFDDNLKINYFYDLVLKISENTKDIKHISKILYHHYCYDNNHYDEYDTIVENALKRRNLDAINYRKGKYNILEYKMKSKPLISIIIPTKDLSSTLDECLQSIYTKTTYDNFEMIIINNNSKEAETFILFNNYKKKYKNFYVIDANIEFNYSKINNLAVENCKGEFIVFLNNDTSIITQNWLELMLGYAQQNHIGAVGCKLLYPDNTIQHAGVILGVNGVASHAFVGYKNTDVGVEGRLTIPYNYSAVTAACLMIEKNKFYEIGGFNEYLKVSYNDVDLNLKLVEKGYFNVFLPTVELYHNESKSRGLETTKEKYKQLLKEQKYMYEKWKNFILNDPMYNENYSKNKLFLLDNTMK